MPTAAELDARIAQLRSEGKTESTSKKLGKLVKQRSSLGPAPGTTAPSGSMTSRISDFFGGQKAETESFLTGARERFGLPQLEQVQQAATSRQLGLEEQLSTLPERIAGETRGFDVNALQKARIQEARQAPLATQAAQAGRDVARATTALQTGQRGLEFEADLLSDRQANRS